MSPPTATAAASTTSSASPPRMQACHRKHSLPAPLPFTLPSPALLLLPLLLYLQCCSLLAEMTVFPGSFINVYVDWQNDSRQKVPDGFMGLSTNYMTMPTNLGNAKFRRLMQNYLDFDTSGKNFITWRAMGIPSRIPLDLWSNTSAASKKLRTKFLLQIPLDLTKSASSNWNPDRYEGVSMIKLATKHIGMDNIVGFALGNEPDWFVNRRGWNKTDYFLEGRSYDRDVRRVEEAVRKTLEELYGSCKMLAGPESANYWSAFKTEDRLNEVLQDHPCMKTATTHHYTGSSRDPSYTFKDILHNNIKYGAVATAKSLVPVAEKNGAEYRLSEMGSLYGGGRFGLSDRYGAALWALDVASDLAFRRVKSIHFNGAGCSSNAVIMNGNCSKQLHVDPSAPGYRPNAVYFGMLMFARATGAGAEVFNIKVDAPGIQASAWAFRSTDPATNKVHRVLVINKDQEKEGKVTVAMVGFFKLKGTFCELTARPSDVPREEATADQIFLCGQQLDANGILTPSKPQLRGVEGKVYYVPNINAHVTAYTLWMNKVTARLLEVEAE